MSASPVTLAELARSVGGIVDGDPDTRVTGVSHDSRRVEPGDLFVAIPGFEVDGHAYVEYAARAGATAAMVGRPGEWSLPSLVVADVRRSIGPVAHRIHGEPTAGMEVVGVTGTNGKTTTSFLVAAVLERRHPEVPIIGTLGMRRGERVAATGLTTPEAPELARWFADLSADGVRGAVMEVSSHALELGRVDGIRFAAGAFTNLSPEHLDFHGTMDAYADAKLGFFRALAEVEAFAAVNADDAWGERFRAAGPETTWRYSLSDRSAEVVAERIDPRPDGTEVHVATPAGGFTTRLALPGRFNVSNALAAATLGVGLGIAPEDVGAALAGVTRVPGRFETYRGAGITAVVDYAHTPDAYARVLGSIRHCGPRRLIVIFGCGGERDRAKRPEMARVVGELADVAYLTLDNPRGEPVERIMADTIPGFEETAVHWERIDDRGEAIRRAVSEAEPGDVVCLLGKGDEEYQWIGDTKHPWSDRDRVREALAEKESPG